MHVVKLEDARTFLERTRSLLEDEVRHNLILGLAGTLRDNPGLYPEQELWLVEDGGDVAGAALRTPPYNLVLGGGSPDALEALARELGGAIPGAVGAVPEIDELVGACSRQHGVTPEARVQQGSTRSTPLWRRRLRRGCHDRRRRTTASCSSAGGASSAPRRSASSNVTRSRTAATSTTS